MIIHWIGTISRRQGPSAARLDGCKGVRGGGSLAPPPRKVQPTPAREGVHGDVSPNQALSPAARGRRGGNARHESGMREGLALRIGPRGPRPKPWAAGRLPLRKRRAGARVPSAGGRGRFAAP